MKFYKFVNALILFTLVHMFPIGSVHGQTLSDDPQLNEILENDIREVIENSYIEFCRDSPDMVQECYQISSAQCIAVTNESINRCLIDMSNYTLRDSITYSSVDDPNQYQLLKCFEVNFYNQVYDMGGGVLDECRW